MLTKCKDCNYRCICRLDSRNRMYSGKCYIDELLGRKKCKPGKIFDMCYQIEVDTGIGVHDITTRVHDLNWQSMTQPEKREIITDMLNWYINLNEKNDKTYIAPSEKMIKRYTELMLEICDCAFDSHRDGDFVKCLRCGNTIPNNKQHNIKYCEHCKRHEPLPTKWKICQDCGEEFKVDTPNNRQFRCDECQLKANKELTRIRVQRYRERKKCNDIHSKD